MQTYLSFIPRYHELTEREGKPVWVPMYNPARECVQREANRIRGEFSQVDSQGWAKPKRKPLDVRELLAGPAAAMGFMAASLAVGWALTLTGPLATWLMALPADRQSAGMIAVGGVAVFCLEALAGMVRLTRVSRF